MNESMHAEIRASSGLFAVIRADASEVSQTCELPYVQPEMLSAFGELVEQLRKSRGMSKRGLAELAGVSSGKLTESLRDREWAKENGKRWYGPDLESVNVWAKAFRLEGDDLRRFIDLAHLAHATAYLRQRFDQIDARNEELTKMVNDVVELVAQHRGELPKTLAQRLLATVEPLED